MKWRLIGNDFQANKLVTAATGLFMAVCAMLLGLSVFLFASLSGAIDSLMTAAETPDFLQMHTGALEVRELDAFAQSRDDVDKMQICRFLNLPNSSIRIGDVSLDGNMQDNGLSCQSACFDYLLDAENRIIRPVPGEVYLPVCYREEYEIRTGELLCIGTEELVVAGFLRDSQMNSMMASSKRFLVSETDYEKCRALGKEEYLIEFKLKEGADLNAFATAYEDAGLPGNGPTITFPLIRMMNALSDGMMILVILLVSTIVLLISMLCIRYMMLTQLEKDKRQIGMLKALGFSKKDVRGLCFAKYLLLSAFGCLAGMLAAALLAKPLGVRMRELYGTAGHPALLYAKMAIGALGAEGLVLLSVRRTLRQTEKMSAIEALHGRGGFGKRKNLWLTAMIVTAASAFVVLVPWNLKNTLQAPAFVTYMGIGDSQIRMDIRQHDDSNWAAQKLVAEIARDGRVQDFVWMQTESYKTILPDGSSYNLMIENGDHGKFPVKYSEGRFPENEGEIALSVLNAETLGVGCGDTLRIERGTKDGGVSETLCTVCGIYSDITNGGKTAKACLRRADNDTPLMWSVIYLTLTEPGAARDWVGEYQARYAAAGGGMKVTMISDYLNGIYGQTITNIGKAAAVSAAAACLVLFTVMLLMIRLVIWRERADSALKKALGYTTADLRREYLHKAMSYFLPGLLIGVLAGVGPGQRLAGTLLGAMGAKEFHFIIDPLAVFLFVPAGICLTSLTAAMLGLAELNGIYAGECLGGSAR